MSVYASYNPSLSPSIVKDIIGSINVEFFYIKPLVKVVVALFIKDLEKVDFLYLPSLMTKLIPIVGR